MKYMQTPEGRKQASDRMKAIIAARGGKTNFQLGKERKTKMPKQKHWTQTPQGRKRMAEIQKEGARARARIAKQTQLNGHSPTSTASAIVLSRTPRGFAKDAVKQFAIIGAKQRLQDLERERETLLIFIRSSEGDVKSGRSDS